MRKIFFLFLLSDIQPVDIAEKALKPDEIDVKKPRLTPEAPRATMYIELYGFIFETKFAKVDLTTITLRRLDIFLRNTLRFSIVFNVFKSLSFAFSNHQ